MATKRQAPDDQIARPSWKRRRTNEPVRPNHGKKSFKKAHPVNELKSQIRSVRRLLERKEDDLPANIRVEKERELQTAERELERAQQAKRRSDMIGKYHRIRFFERQKAERRLKRAKKELKSCVEDGQKAELAQKVEEAEIDLNYALYYPLDKDYVSLFPTRRKKGESEPEHEDGNSPTPDSERVDKERQGNPEMWELVKKCWKEGTLADLREGKLANGAANQDEASEKLTASPTKKIKASKEQRSGGLAGNKVDEDDAGSDDEGGTAFFKK